MCQRIAIKESFSTAVRKSESWPCSFEGHAHLALRTVTGAEKRRRGQRRRIVRSGPNLEPGTMRVYVTNGPRNGLNIGWKVGRCPGSRRRWVQGGVHAFLKPYMTQTHTVPGCRLGADLPTAQIEQAHTSRKQRTAPLGLQPILPWPILYGVWHTKGGSGGVVYCAQFVQ